MRGRSARSFFDGVSMWQALEVASSGAAAAASAAACDATTAEAVVKPKAAAEAAAAAAAPELATSRACYLDTPLV